VFPTPQLPADAEAQAAALRGFAQAYPNIVGMSLAVEHSGGACDADAEFSFALDLLLDGIEQHHRSGWTPAQLSSTTSAPGDAQR
jgi:hypothetical protein